MRGGSSVRIEGIRMIVNLINTINMKNVARKKVDAPRTNKEANVAAKN